MSEYYSTNKTVITDFSEENISSLYNQGYVFTRLAKGAMNQTRSLRIDLTNFELNSENRRILKKVESLKLKVESLPLLDYSWEIHKMGKDFYSTKFGDDTMSASKIKEMFQEPEKSNMNMVMSYELGVVGEEKPQNASPTTHNYIGYCLAYVNSEMVHYAYPFYDLSIPVEQNLGMGMMINAIIWAKENGKKYIYLGSVVDSKSKYKLQFNNLEWWNKSNWSSNLEELKTIIAKN